MPEIINLNDSAPPAPANAVNVHWQKGAQTGTDPATGYPINPVSAYLLIVVDYVPAGAINGSNTVFTLPVTPVWYQIYVNGQKLSRNTNPAQFTLSGATITLGTAPATGDIVEVTYGY